MGILIGSVVVLAILGTGCLVAGTYNKDYLYSVIGAALIVISMLLSFLSVDGYNLTLTNKQYHQECIKVLEIIENSDVKISDKEKLRLLNEIAVK